MPITLKTACRQKLRKSGISLAALPQNIRYCVRQQAKTVSDIADDLGVSPVYIEGEVEFPEVYC